MDRLHLVPLSILMSATTPVSDIHCLVWVPGPVLLTLKMANLHLLELVVEKFYRGEVEANYLLIVNLRPELHP